MGLQLGLPIESGADVLNTHTNKALRLIDNEKDATIDPNSDFSADSVILLGGAGESSIKTQVVMKIRGEVTTDPTRVIEILEGLI